MTSLEAQWGVATPETPPRDYATAYNTIPPPVLLNVGVKHSI